MWFLLNSSDFINQCSSVANIHLFLSICWYDLTFYQIKIKIDAKQKRKFYRKKEVNKISFKFNQRNYFRFSKFNGIFFLACFEKKKKNKKEKLKIISIQFQFIGIYQTYENVPSDENNDLPRANDYLHLIYQSCRWNSRRSVICWQHWVFVTGKYTEIHVVRMNLTCLFGFH